MPQLSYLKAKVTREAKDMRQPLYLHIPLSADPKNVRSYTIGMFPTNPYPNGRTFVASSTIKCREEKA